MEFESQARGNTKQFVVTFPIDALLGIAWKPNELTKLNDYDASDNISDKLRMLAMIARKVETVPGRTIKKEKV